MPENENDVLRLVRETLPGDRTDELSAAAHTPRVVPMNIDQRTGTAATPRVVPITTKPADGGKK